MKSTAQNRVIQTCLESKKAKLTIFDQMGHCQANIPAGRNKTKLQSEPRGKANDHEKVVQRTFLIDTPKCLVNVVM